MDRQKFLEEQRKALEESIEFFSNSRKPERELWVAKLFITNLNVSFSNQEVRSAQQDPPDVVFRNAQFEIKEILDPGRRRHDEYKQALARANQAEDPTDLLETFTPRGISLKEVVDLISDEVAALEQKYPPEVRKKLDLLFYVNLQHVIGLLEEPSPTFDMLSSAGWRSVSFVKGNWSCILFAAPEAPVFLRGKIGTVSHRQWQEEHRI